MSFFIRVVEGDKKFRFTEKSLPENNKILLKLDVHKQLLLVASIILDFLDAPFKYGTGGY